MFVRVTKSVAFSRFGSTHGSEVLNARTTLNMAQLVKLSIKYEPKVSTIQSAELTHEMLFFFNLSYIRPVAMEDQNLKFPKIPAKFA